jgi:hypothetical protein
VIATVVYGRVTDLDAARRCQRCDSGRERHGPQAGRPCPRCEGTGVHPEGWEYLLPRELELIMGVGDVVACPPTPRSHGVEVLATVVDVRSGTAQRNPARRLKTIIRRASWQEANA